jgi:hypothetical protein
VSRQFATRPYRTTLERRVWVSGSHQRTRLDMQLLTVRRPGRKLYRHISISFALAHYISACRMNILADYLSPCHCSCRQRHFHVGQAARFDQRYRHELRDELRLAQRANSSGTGGRTAELGDFNVVFLLSRTQRSSSRHTRWCGG